jgi:hypothetical protein
MTPRVYTAPSGGWAVLEAAGGWYMVRAYSAAGQVLDSTRCDTWAEARVFWRAFKALAKGAV